MGITVEVRPTIIDVTIQGADTTVEVSAGIAPLAWGSLTGTLANQTDLQTELDAKLDKTSEIQNLEVVSVLPGTPDPTTIYFIVP